MDWLEQNLDAYRIVAEILNELRLTVRRGLERLHGDEWFRNGLPAGLLERLINSKEQEKAIDWYESEYQQVIDYAVFPDLLEILEHQAESFAAIIKLAPSPALLHARFLELEVMRSKLGRTRPVSESEISFLSTFHLRFRKAIESQHLQWEEADTQASAIEVEEDETESSSSAPSSNPSHDREDPSEAADESTPSPKKAPPPTPIRPPSRPATTSVAGGGNAAPAVAEAAEPVPEDEPEADDEPERPPSFSTSLANHDTRAILRELYREVTAIADSISSSEVLPATLVWDEVTSSPWFEENFSKLGLTPLSDFYEIVNKVEKKASEGIAKDELHRYLKEANFANVLLSLRDMFQKIGL